MPVLSCRYPTPTGVLEWRPSVESNAVASISKTSTPKSARSFPSTPDHSLSESDPSSRSQVRTLFSITVKNRIAFTQFDSSDPQAQEDKSPEGVVPFQNVHGRGLLPRQFHQDLPEAGRRRLPANRTGHVDILGVCISTVIWPVGGFRAAR